MTDYLIKFETLESIANSIRSKNGVTDTFTPTEMPAKIEDIADTIFLMQKFLPMSRPKLYPSHRRLQQSKPSLVIR